MITIVGCGTLGTRVAKLEQREQQSPFCITASKESAEKLIKQGFDACDINSLWINNEQKEKLDQTQYLYYFAPPPSTGSQDTSLFSFLQNFKGDKLKKAMLISTTGVYGHCDGEWIDEAQPLLPKVDRAKRRIDAEKQMQNFCQSNNIDYSIFRVAGLYGPEKLPLKRLQKQEPILSIDQSPWSNRIHLEDLAQMCFLASRKKLGQQIYNLTDGHPTTMSDFFIQVAKSRGLTEPEQISFADAEKQLSKGMMSYLNESKRIKNTAILRDLDYQLKYPTLKEGLQYEFD